ncbi:MAG: ubiquinone biosynthesis regulatory protein kinase UbiB, partial [Gammaproteobacteria bacterium]
MKSNRSSRLTRILRVMARHGLDEYVFKLSILKPYRLLRYALPVFWFRRPSGDRGQRLRQALEEL